MQKSEKEKEEEEEEENQKQKENEKGKELEKEKEKEKEKKKGKVNENLLEQPGVYFFFAHHKELPKIPLYIGRTKDIKRQISGDHGFVQNFEKKFKTALLKVTECEDFKLDLSLTVVYTKNDFGKLIPAFV